MIRTSLFKLEKKLIKSGYDFVIGVDEAGRGPLAGPVVACACTLRTFDVHYGHRMSTVRDSKLLSEKQREELYDFICEHFYVGVGICNHRTIDRINILEATFLSMKKAISDLERKIKKQDTRYKHQKNFKFQMTNFKSISNDKFQNSKYIVLVDGNKIIPNLSMEQRAITSGDNLVKSISAASIIAKVTRDRIMRKMHEKYPQYCFHRHKGYGTKLHMEMIEKHGPCGIHRKSFSPVCTFLGSKKSTKRTAAPAHAPTNSAFVR